MTKMNKTAKVLVAMLLAGGGVVTGLTHLNALADVDSVAPGTLQHDFYIDVPVSPVQENLPAQWTNIFTVTLPHFPVQEYMVGNISFRMNPDDIVRFNFFRTSSFRVGMTNNGQVSGTIWASGNQGTLVIPGTGDWRFIIQNLSAILPLINIEGQFIVTTHSPISPVESFNHLWEQVLTETLSTDWRQALTETLSTEADLIFPSFFFGERELFDDTTGLSTEILIETQTYTQEWRDLLIEIPIHSQAYTREWRDLLIEIPDYTKLSP